MNYITHSIGGLGAGMAVLSLMEGLDEISKVTIVSGAIFGSLLPDIDHTKSFMGRKAPIVSHVVAATFKHRGFLHTPVFIIISAVFLFVAAPLITNVDISRTFSFFTKGLIPGMVTHILLDSFNKGGIPWLWPVTDKRFRLLSIKTDSVLESVFSLGLSFIIIFVFFSKN